MYVTVNEDSVSDTVVSDTLHIPNISYRPFAVHQRVRICSRPVACSFAFIKNLTTHIDSRALWLCLYVPIF
jgi:hypothetical protein